MANIQKIDLNSKNKNEESDIEIDDNASDTMNDLDDEEYDLNDTIDNEDINNIKSISDELDGDEEEDEEEDEDEDEDDEDNYDASVNVDNIKSESQYDIYNEEDTDIFDYNDPDVEIKGDKRIPDNERTTIPRLTKYEKVRILGTRAKQISDGSKVFIKSNKVKNAMDIAELELEYKVIPLKIKRPLPNGRYEIWAIKELEII